MPLPALPNLSSITLLTDFCCRAYTSLSPRIRALFGLGIMANAALALQFSDDIERFLGLVPTKEEEQRLREALPKVSAVERER
jgi:hypothetical protein